MKKNGIILLISVCILNLISCSFNNLGEATKTVNKLGDNLYYMELSGDDGFEGFLAQGGAANADELAEYLNKFLGKGPFAKSVTVNPIETACSTYIAPDGEDGFTVGRNFDWEICTALILKNSPDSGYASISTCNLDFLGFGEGFTPEGMVNSIKALAGIYVPLDGINEAGLVVADLMTGDDEVTNQDSGKADLTITSAIRLLLNKAASVEEAVDLLGQYDIHSDINKGHHLFIADKTGKSIAVEWVNNKMYVVEAPALTNHYLCEEKKNVGAPGSVDRFNKIVEMVHEKGNMDVEAGKNLMHDVGVDMTASSDGEGTQWSIVYSLSKSAFAETFYWRYNYDEEFSFQIK